MFLFLKFLLKNIVLLFKRAMELLFKAKNSPRIEILEVTGNSTSTNSFFQLSIQFENLLFIKLDNGYMLAANDGFLTLNIPLKEKTEIRLKGYGMFKTTRRFSWSVANQLNLKMHTPEIVKIIQTPIQLNKNYSLKLPSIRQFLRLNLTLKKQSIPQGITQIGITLKQPKINFSIKNLESKLKSNKHE